MDPSSKPVLKDLVLVGGGHSHVGVIKSFGMDPMPGVRLTVISRDVHAPYSGMLPGLIAGHYAFDDAHLDLGPLTRFAGARFLHDEVFGIDPEAKTVTCRSRPPVPYDVLSINIGSTPGLDVPGARGSVVPVKPIDGFWRRWEELRDRCLERRDETHIGVVGGGAGGVEVLLAVQFRLRQLLELRHRGAAHLRFHLATLGEEILPTHNPRVRAKFGRVLQERGVNVLTGRRVTQVWARESEGEADLGDQRPFVGSVAPTSTPCRPYRLHFEGGDHLDLDEVLWVTTARATGWPGDSGLDVDERGFIKVRDTLQTLGFPDVFAAGDIAAVADYPRPKAGVFAVRQGPPLSANLRRRLLGEPTEPFRPQEGFLSLISTGDKYAVASRGEWVAEGRWVWRWKDGIDRRFMDKFNRLPPMGDRDGVEIDPRLMSEDAVAELARAGHRAEGQGLPRTSDARRALDAISGAAMRCGGCGSKVGASLLGRVLAGLEPRGRDDIVVGLDAPDDAAVIEIPAGKQLVQTVDFFRSFIEDPFVFGKIAATHALGDVFAMGAEPQTALATVTIPFGLEAKVEADLVQLLSGALETFEAEETALVGGHTSEGAELALGFTVSGIVDAGRAIGKSGMRPGDALILTKPLGTGALLAADMRWRAKGRWVETALSSMVQSSGGAARCLVEHGATAMTDVTGFGLLGHLVEMTNASRVDATINLRALPVLDGTLEVMRRGFFSSLHANNTRLRRTIANLEQGARHIGYPLIFDPQTAGGLLAGVPGDRAAACVDDLRRLGFGRATIIGSVREASMTGTPIRLEV